MTHAEKVKRWVYALLATGADVYASRERAKVSKKLHAAIDEMQSEIDRLKLDAERAHRYGRLLIGFRSAMRAAGKKANYSTDWQHMVSAIDAAMKERGEEA